ncbi:MAG: S8 family peptidase [Oscillospiraceae bacterium]|nr:S8 family peptidase [Oscillospiraceae bacterium]
MAYDRDLEAFIYDDSTAALVLKSENLYLLGNSEVRLGKTLSGGEIVVYVKEEDIPRFVNYAGNYVLGVYPLTMGLMGERELGAAGILPLQNQPALNLRGSGVLLGFVDTGIDFTMDAFRWEDGSSRVAAIWDQSIPGAPPESFLYGTEYTREQINEALNTQNPFEKVPHRDTVGHGTFLASVAASRERDEYAGAAPDAEIIVVKLRRACPFARRRFLVPETQENVFAGDDLMLGVQYILEKALALGRPAAICCGIGTNLGSHDGFQTAEEYLAEVSGIAGMLICCAAGNESGAGHHTNGRIGQTGGTADIELRAAVAGEDIYISIFNSAADRLSVSVRSPGNEEINRVPAQSGISYERKLIMERSTVMIDYMFPIVGSGGQFTRVKILDAAQGIWRITVHGDYILDGLFHARLPITGFINPGTVFLSAMPNYTIVTPATSLGVICCGAYDSRDNSLSPTTSWGPSQLPSVLPDLVAPGVDVAGLFPGNMRGVMSGTSVAAAITAGAGALFLEWGIVQGNNPSLNTYTISANLLSGNDRDPGVTYPSLQWGFGRLDLLNTFRFLRPL